MKARLPSVDWAGVEWAGVHWAGVHWPSVRGRARADAGPLSLVAAVVLVVSLLTAAVPPLMRSTADDAARDAIRRAGPDAAVRVESGWQDDYGPTGGRVRNEHLADDVDNLRILAENDLAPELRNVLQPPVTTATSVTFKVTDGSVLRQFQLGYVRNDSDGPAVTWVAGHSPRGTVTGNEEIPLNGPKWEAQVGLSEAVAAALKLGPGDHVPVEDDLRNKYNVLVSGVFRPVDPDDPAWRLVPWALRPVTNLDGYGGSRLGGLLSAESLPDGRLALLPDQFQRTAWYAADADKLTWESAQRLATTVANLKAASGSSADRDETLRWNTQLDSVLREVRGQVDAAFAQASVLLIAILAGAVLVLLLAAELLTRRRASALVTARRRGAGLPALATELLIESAAVTAPAAALGVGLALVLAGGAALWWVAPVVVCAVAAGPAFGVVTAARATRDRRAPANRAARRRAYRTGQLRRATVDVTVLIAAAGAVVALRQRGIAYGQDVALPASAPTLGVVAGALLLVRLMPAVTRFALRQFLRSARALPVFGAARAAATATRALPLLALTVTFALAGFAVTLDTTTSRGAVDGAWQETGADVRLDLVPGPATSVEQIATRLAAAPGVTHAVAGQVTDGVSAIADNNAITPTLVVVDTAAFRQLRAGTPLPGLPPLGPAGGTVPALVRAGDGSLRPGMAIRLSRENAKPLQLTAVGTAPAVDGAGDLIIVDAASGLSFTPNTVWVTGPGAARAVADAATGGHAVVRTDVLHDRRSAPLNAGLAALDRTAAGLLPVLGLLGFALAAAASAPDRWTTLARLRTLGLRPRDARRVAAAELLPPVLAAALCGPLLALLLVELTFGPLALRALTGQTTDPSPVVPWWMPVAVAVALLAGLAGVVAAEAGLRRRRLADSLRVGDS